MLKRAVLWACAAIVVPITLASQAQPSPSGTWVLTADFFGTPLFFRLELEQHGQTLTGTLDGDTLTGTISGQSVRLLAKGKRGGREELTGTLQNGALSGTSVWIQGDDPSHPYTHQFTATPALHRRAAPARRYEFTPTVFYRQFAGTIKPVLTIAPGDTVHTTTVDAFGIDASGARRVLGGNPQTGPFYIENAIPGDILAVHLTHLRLNRDWAMSDDAIVPRGLDDDLAVKMKDGGKSVRWHLDQTRGTASLDKPDDRLSRYAIALRPMLGCIGVAPNPARAAPDTRDSGPWGGNMDFNEIIEGATVYLPVSVPGAFLYLGDAHAAQGDGELNGDALETSMDVEFTVDVIPATRIRGPRVESSTYVMAMGLEGSLDDAFRTATANMADWLSKDYKLTPSELAQVLGSAAEYRVTEVADPNAGIVLKINKERLRLLRPGTS